MRGADILVEMLIGYGVDVIFGVPGDTNVPFYEALQQREDQIRHVMARDERSAGYMADAYGRFTSKPGIFECPSGAGAMYSLPPVAESNSSSVPVILLTIDIPLPGEGRGVLTELDCARLFEPITKMSVQVKSPEKLPEIIRRAFRVACSGKPGAVHLQIPEDMLLAEVDEARISLHVEKDCVQFPAFPTLPSREKLDGLMSLLTETKRPLIVSGGGVNRSCAGSEVTALAEKLNVPVCTTMTGQGTMPDDHRLAIGVIGDNGFHPHANWALEHADFVLFVGSRMGSVVTIGWTFPKVTLNKRVAQVDIDPEIMANNYENVISIPGDAKLVLKQLIELAPEQPDATRTEDWVNELNALRSDFWKNAEILLSDESTPLRPERVVRCFNDALEVFGRPAHIYSDAGTPTPHMTRFLKLRDRRTRFAIPRAFGGLGSALPATVGAWYADKQCRPIGMFGDGSFGMTVGELETLVRLQVPAILLLFNNGTFGWIKGLHRLNGHNQCFGVDFMPPRGQAIAEAFGVKAWTAKDSRELDAALANAFAYTEGPCLIDIHVESIADRVPPVYSWLSKRGRNPLSTNAEEVRYF
ncbi:MULTISPECIES: thiamine pyrophosphate-binding protein [unclassified Mesorhizobium]|uniref:thiamine pyrophosphate-binding protein n=1 Tax=unclassified Mesorhizobium TaxID=325217 RepID=UPI000FCA5594|nr:MULTISPECIES: thiamine pyrophosphate-binding protein [unclassified Mesorhizobium]RUU25280.1 thiamine pyrophosphate-binding protein [Mesorhizobium sp. M6A.T.Ce.TU.016.01.1.1]RWJ96305.1 MAG: thiamine pyrophosphate-binding protein [Mesorhizobium sp.]TIN06137.1 MAG: thiamine pyrophosphate-binding protein [Mesorhizobium sp.]